MTKSERLPFNSEFSLKANFAITYGVFLQRLKTITRYKGSLIFDMIMPTLFALFPILMGRSVAGSNEAAAQNFAIATGSSQYILYMVIGANIFQITNGAINNFGFFLRKEQMQGTLESLYLTPAKQVYILYGTGLYTVLRAIVNFFVSLALASLLFGINPFVHNFGIGILFLLIGMIPIYGLAFGFGALIIKYKEITSLQMMITWFLSTLMGIFYPISALPRFIRYVAFLFPPTWHNLSVKAAIVDTSYIIRDIWYYNIGIIALFAVIYPLIGAWLYSAVSKQMKRTQGLGVF